MAGTINPCSRPMSVAAEISPAQWHGRSATVGTIIAPDISADARQACPR